MLGTTRLHKDYQVFYFEFDDAPTNFLEYADEFEVGVQYESHEFLKFKTHVNFIFLILGIVSYFLFAQSVIFSEFYLQRL